MLPVVALLTLIVFILAGVSLFAWLKWQEAERIAASLRALIEERDSQLVALERFAHIPGIIEKAKKTKETIEAQLEDARQQADRIVRSATYKADEISRESAQTAKLALAQVEAQRDSLLEQIKAEVKQKREKADRLLADAVAEASVITAEAETRAKQIAGNAYDALKRADFYGRAVDAMKNAAKGYGDRYVIPTLSILDGLADDFGYSNAGEKLRLARERTKLLVKQRLAAVCDYAEASRRELAIHFVLDAFDGKVESILARVKHDNVGKLQQEIKDAFGTVNFNGDAFRKARITDEYLAARLNELKWASAVHELRLKEREEQRAIKEQIREEEKARREYERAIKQAQRDEEMINQAITRLRGQYEHAGIAERSKYEAQLAELDLKLKEAEARNQRAMSMAQQTKCGHVYVISNIGSFGEDVVKIGLTRRLEPIERIRELGDASVPFPFDVHALIYSEEAPQLELTLHRRFLQMQMNKANPRKEFFRVGLAEIRKVVESMKLDAKWTLAAEAREYRETRALEERLRDDPEFRQRWLAEQSIIQEVEAAEEEDIREEESLAPASDPDD